MGFWVVEMIGFFIEYGCLDFFVYFFCCGMYLYDVCIMWCVDVVDFCLGFFGIFYEVGYVMYE